jgi:Pyruvate/2-oxoacid:ferredoxin oxidoreductase gamma subunit
MDEHTLNQRMDEGKYHEAFVQIKEYLKDHPSDKLQLKLLGKLQNEYRKKGQKDILVKVNGKIEIKQFDDAINLINEYLEIVPDDKHFIQMKEKIAQDKIKYEIDTGYLAAKEQFDLQNYSEAIGILTPLLKKYKSDPKLTKLKDDAENERWTQQSTKWISEAQAFLQSEEFENALKKIEMVTKRDSSNKVALKLREKILEDQKKIGKKKLWDEINTQIKIQNYSIALDRIKELLALDPNDVKAQKLQSSIIETEMKFEKKKVMDRALAELNSYKFNEARKALDSISEHLKNDKDIMELNDTINAAEQKYTLDNLLTMAKNLIKSKDYEKAEAKVDEALKASNNLSKEAITLKADLQKKLKKDKIDKLMDILPVYQKGKNYEDALQVVNQILELDEENQKALKLKAQYEKELGIAAPEEKAKEAPAASSAKAEEEGAPAPGEVQVVREYDYVGGEIRFKVAVRNNTETAITNITVLLNVTEQYTIESLTKKVPFLAPGESRGVDFMLMPMACGQSKVFGTVSYSDAFGEPQSITIKPKEIAIKCPLVIPETATREEIDDWLKSQLKSTCAVDLGNNAREQGFKVANEQIAALDLHNVFVDDVKLMSEFLGIAKVTQNKILIRATALEDKVQIDVFTDDMKSATGILAYIRNLIQISMNVQSDLQGKEDKIGVQLINAFEIIGRLTKLCDLCQILGSVKDGRFILTEITTQVESSYLASKLSADLTHWKEILEQQQDEKLSEEIANDLEYNAIGWIKTAHQITQSKYGVYKDTFDSSTSAATQKIERQINTIVDGIAALENAYMRRIIRYLMIIHKENGLVLYTQGFGNTKFDSDLVGGFLTAIQSFGTEISGKGTPVTKLAYKDFELELKAGNFITTAIVLAGKATDLIRRKLNIFTDDFERKFKMKLEKWDGNIDAFKTTQPLVNKTFTTEESA